MLSKKILKRDGREVDFDASKIANAISKAVDPAEGDNPAVSLEDISKIVLDEIENKYVDSTTPDVEGVQDIIERVLMTNGYPQTAKNYILYRADRTRIREMHGSLMKIYEGLTFVDSKDNDLKRENANIDGNTAMGTMLRYGSEGSKRFNELFVLKPEHSQAHINGDIHIHDLDFLTLTMTCCQIDLAKLFKGGFFTGHGTLREPTTIRSASSLACIAIQSNQNDQHGGQSIPAIDYYLAPYVGKSYVRNYISNLKKAAWLSACIENVYVDEILNDMKTNEPDLPMLTMGGVDEYQKVEKEYFLKWGRDKIRKDYWDKFVENIDNMQSFTESTTLSETESETWQAMEALIHNLNTLNSRSGGQTPFSSINLGTDTSLEGRMVTRNILKAIDAGLGNHETSIFPVSIFKVKDGINGEEGDPNYDLFLEACRVSSKRLFPNFSFIDAPFNLKYYKAGEIDSEIAYMGCRTRTIANVYDTTREIVTGRGNLSFTSINLPRLGILANHDIDKFFEMLEEKLILVKDQLLDRMRIQGNRRVKNFPFLMGQGIWIDSEKLGPEDKVAEVIKHGSLSIGFIGLAETLVALIGKHHGESEEAQELGLRIIGFMNDRANEYAEQYKLNFGILATPAEGLSSRFTKMDKKKFGIIPGVTDREYYTNSFHVPVYFPISAYKKIQLEAPYHALCPAGHISYIEMDGDPSQNVEAFVHLIKAMKKAGIGYGAINHPVDRCPRCGYSGVLKDECPNCGLKEKESHTGWIKIRRITGYLVGDITRFNDGKRAEEHDRVKHNI